MYLRALIDQSCSETYSGVVDNWIYLHTGREICFWNTLYLSILKHKMSLRDSKSNNHSNLEGTESPFGTTQLRVQHNHVLSRHMLINTSGRCINLQGSMFFLLLDSFPDDLLCIQTISETSSLFERGNLISWYITMNLHLLHKNVTF